MVGRFLSLNDYKFILKYINKSTFLWTAIFLGKKYNKKQKDYLQIK